MSKHDKIIERIRRLLAMAGDTSSPNEAAIAAKRARHLMDEYQINELDLTTIDEHDMGVSDYTNDRKTVSKVESILAVAVATLNDTQVRYTRVDFNRVMRFEGLLVDTVCAIELFKYLLQEAYKQAERYETGRADRHAYRLGFVAGVAAQVREILKDRRKVEIQTAQGSTSLVVCKQALVAKHFNRVKYSNTGSTFSGGRDSYGAGKAAGQRAGLSRQVKGTAQRQLA